MPGLIKKENRPSGQLPDTVILLLLYTSVNDHSFGCLHIK